MILPLEHVHDDRLEVDALDVGFAVGAAVATEVVEDDVDSLVVAIGHDRGRPIGLTHHKLHATEPGFKRDRADWFLPPGPFHGRPVGTPGCFRIRPIGNPFQ
jgi:hypothetical protein